MGYEDKKSEGKPGAVDNPPEVHPREADFERVRSALAGSRVALHREIDATQGGVTEAVFNGRRDRDKKPTPLQEKTQENYFRTTTAIAEAMLESVQSANKAIDQLKAAEAKLGFFTRSAEAPTFEVKTKDMVSPALRSPQTEIPLLLDGPTKKQSRKEIDDAVSTAYAVVRKISESQIFIERGPGGIVGKEISDVLYASQPKFSSSVMQEARSLQQALRNLQEAVKVKLGDAVNGDRGALRLKSDDI